MEDKKYASVRFSKQKIVPKAFMKTRQIKLRDGFKFQQTTFVPEAQEGKPMPMVCMTLSVGGESIRLNAGTSEDLLVAVSAMLEELKNSRNQIDEAVFKEQEQWYAIHDAIRSVKSAAKGVNFDTEEQDENVIPFKQKKIG
jgi:hypothetical protein